MSLPVLNRQLVLEAAQGVADGSGGYAETWVALGTIWARVTARTGRERAGPAATLSVVSYRIMVRGTVVGSAARPQAGQRLRDGTRVYAIQAVAEADADGRYLECFAVEEVSA